MASDEIRVGDYGTVLRATILDQDGTVIDISSATTKQIILLRPDATTLTGDATFYTDGTDGKLQYEIQDGDLTICGIWRVQWYVVLSSGSWKTDIKTIKIYNNLS